MFSKNLQMPLTFLWPICTGHCKVNHAIHVLRPLPTSVTQDNDVEILGGDGLLAIAIALEGWFGEYQHKRSRACWWCR